MVQRFVDDALVPGVITLVTRRDKVVHAQCFGMLDIEARRPMNFDALFRLFSMTKIVTCAATLMLYEEGAFLLDDWASYYLPDLKSLQVEEVAADGSRKLVPPRRNITIHDLLTHLGGLSYDGVYDAYEKHQTLAQWLPTFCARPLLGHPGETWRYSASIDILARLIEVLSGKPFDEFLQQRIFAPLGMTDTGFFVPPDKRTRLATVYEPDTAGTLRPIDPKHGKSPYYTKPAFLSGGGGMIAPNAQTDPPFAGGLVSSSSDYLSFAQMLMRGGTWGSARLLSPHTVRMMTSDHLPPGHPPMAHNKRRAGMGVSVLASTAETQMIGSVGEFGWGGAVCTQVWMDPKEEMVVQIMLQCRPAQNAPLGSLPLMRKFKVLAYQAIVESKA
mgnify:FL=1